MHDEAERIERRLARHASTRAQAPARTRSLPVLHNTPSKPSGRSQRTELSGSEEPQYSAVPRLPALTMDFETHAAEPLRMSVVST